MNAVHLALERAQRRLLAHLEDLDQRLASNDANVLREYCEVVAALAAVAPMTSPEARGALLTTEEMAERLAISPKTLLRRKGRGEIRPALQKGRLIRWRAADAVAAR